MAAPTITSIAFDQTSYVPGATIKATVTYTPGVAPKSFTFTAVVTDTVTAATGTGTGTFSVAEPDATTVTASDTGSRTWTKVSDSGTVAVFTATA